MRRQQQHDEEIRQVKEILHQAGYSVGRSLYSRTMDVEFFLGRGSVVVIGVCNHKDAHGIDILIPLSLSNRTDEILDALRKPVA